MQGLKPTQLHGQPDAAGLNEKTISPPGGQMLCRLAKSAPLSFKGGNNLVEIDDAADAAITVAIAMDQLKSGSIANRRA